MLEANIKQFKAFLLHKNRFTAKNINYLLAPESCRSWQQDNCDIRGRVMSPTCQPSLTAKQPVFWATRRVLRYDMRRNTVRQKLSFSYNVVPWHSTCVSTGICFIGKCLCLISCLANDLRSITSPGCCVAPVRLVITADRATIGVNSSWTGGKHE